MGMNNVRIHVKAIWDPEACVWVATSEDVPGLLAEAETPEALVDKLRILIPELLELNGSASSPNGVGIPFHLMCERTEMTAF